MKIDGFIHCLLPSQYGIFQINYNYIKDKQNVYELTSMVVDEDARLKQHEQYYTNFGIKKAEKKKYHYDKIKGIGPPKGKEYAKTHQV